MSLRERIKRIFKGGNETHPAKGYDLWSASYDQQPGNLMLDLDEFVFSNLLEQVSLKDQTIVDIGCGTGRHWKKILEQEPHTLIGYDVSPGMLAQLKQKYPQAEVKEIKNEQLVGMPDESCDGMISTLTIAHIENIEKAISEWDRVLKQNSWMIITDYHPAALEKGARRTFQYEGKTIAVKNHIYPIDQLRKLLEQRGFREVRFIERKIDGSVRSYYEKQNALALYEKFKNVPVIFGFCLKR